MSRNNVILVVHDKRRGRNWYYVLADLDADTEWSAKYAKKIIYDGNLKRTRNRAIALLLAHNFQKKTKTEYGVRELSIHM